MKIQPGPGQRFGQQASGRSGAAEDVDPQRAVPLLRSSCSRPAHQDHQPPRLHWSCVQEINL